MEESVQSQNKYKTWFFISLFINVFLIVASVFYYLGGQPRVVRVSRIPSNIVEMQISPEKIYPSKTATVSATPLVDTVEGEGIVPVGPNTVSFARVGENTYLRYRGKIYDDTDQFEPHEVKLPDSEQITWYGLVDAPPGIVPNEFMTDEMFGFKAAPDKQSLSFLMRWGDQPTQYHLFYYAPFDKYRQSILMKIFNEVVKIDQFSPDNNYLSIKYFTCWNCGGPKLETGLIRLSDNVIKKIGRTSYFKWLEEGRYEYKDYIVKECTGEGPGECFEEPANLPLKTGQF